MEMLSEHKDTVFLGQSVEVKGTAMRNTLVDCDQSKLIELPVCEDMQAGMANGMALAGKIPVSIFPRWNFMLLAANQIVNHLDKIPLISDYPTKVIMRTSIGSQRPLFPGHQHIADFTDGFRLMVDNIEIIRLDEPEDIFPAYEKALNRTDGKSTILVEWGDYYNEK